MKKFLLSLFSLLVLNALPLQALRLADAQREAWFLTDKMAYELNLTPEQYERAYEVNLEYFLSVNRKKDCLGYYWNYRNADFRYILFDWQYTLYTSIDYFYRPLRWINHSWHFAVCDHYRRGYYYFERPRIYVSYTGGHWHRRSHNDISPYRGWAPRPASGMRDHYMGGQRPDHRPEPAYRPNTHRDNARPGNGRPAGNTRPTTSTRPSRNEGRPSTATPSRTSQDRQPAGSSRTGHNAGSRSFGR
ncbi:MAG: hypothetical protein ACI353_06465 [Alloprevotella sp.]